MERYYLTEGIFEGLTCIGEMDRLYLILCTLLLKHIISSKGLATHYILCAPMTSWTFASYRSALPGDASHNSVYRISSTGLHISFPIASRFPTLRFLRPPPTWPLPRPRICRLQHPN